VATVAIDGARNGGLLAIQILAVGDAGLTERLMQFKQSMAKAVIAKNT
jgi:5-(carboxyamino)imidazole ribonucleotide mutase